MQATDRLPAPGGAARRWIQVTALGDLLGQRALLHPDREALVFPTERVSYREFAVRAQDFARGLVGPRLSRRVNQRQTSAREGVHAATAGTSAAQGRR